MRRLLLLGIFLNAALLGVRAWQDHPVHAGTVVTANGDTNGDGERDISDAVFLLAWLFNGGPEPVACAEADVEGRISLLERDMEVLRLQIDESSLSAEQKEKLGFLADRMEVLETPIEDERSISPSGDFNCFPWIPKSATLIHTIRFSRINLQIVNGLGATNGATENPFDYQGENVNGLGNLILGYNERATAEPENFIPGCGFSRIGSHNLVVGPGNSYIGYGGIVAGRNVSTVGRYSCVIAGEKFMASSDFCLNPPTGCE